MSQQDDQRFPRPQGPFGWKGLGRDKTSQTTIATVAAVINWVLVVYTVSQLGAKDDAGNFSFTAEQITTGYYILAAITVAVCSGSAALIRYPDAGSRWGARLFVCALPAALVLILPLIWGN
ncbi:MAG: hypothetical protein ACR2PM_12600 [Hyphomicrobiales bacterium]